MLQELKDINKHLATMNKALEGQESRIRTLENWRWYMIGSSAVIGVAAAKFTHAMLNI